MEVKRREANELTQLILICLFSSIFLFAVAFGKDLGMGTELFFTCIANGVGSVIMGCLAYFYRKRLWRIRSFEIFKKYKIKLYLSLLSFMGIPYWLMIFWLIKHESPKEAGLLFAIFALSIVYTYFYDWKKINNFSA